MAEVTATHPALRAQSALTQAAASGVEGARWQYYPTPSISVEHAAARQNDPSYQGDDQVLLLGLRQPLWTAGRLGAGVDKASAALARSQSSQDEVRLQLLLRLVQSYGEWLTASEKARAYEVGLSAHQQLQALVERRVAEGQSAQSDLALAESRLAALESDLSVVRTQSSIALARLSQLVGRRIDEQGLMATPSVPPLIEPSLPELIQDAKDTSPALRRAQAQADESKAQIDLLRAERWPEVFARLERQHGSFSVRDSDPQNRLFIGVSSRFGAGLSNQSAISEATLQHEAALAEIEALARTIQEQILVDHAQLVSVARREAVLQKANASAKEVLQSWDRQFLAGRKTWQDLMNSLKEQVQLDVQFADLSGTRLVSAWRIKLMTEGGRKAVSEGGRVHE